ncbi:MAG: hypothetical protein R3F50_09580 [Gammaproteobacteria bacterium]|jgi:hypothetical protein
MSDSSRGKVKKEMGVKESWAWLGAAQHFFRVYLIYRELIGPGRELSVKKAELIVKKYEQNFIHHF